MQVIDFSKYENYIRVGHNGTDTGNHTYTCSDLQNFPTPSTIGVTLHDVDKDPFTDLDGYTHRNRVRHDVYDIEIGYSVLSDNDLAYILNRISPEWIYIELIDKKQRTHTVDNNGYWKLEGKTDGATYWFNTTNGTIYNASYSTTGVSQDFNNYTQVTVPVRTVHKVYASDKNFNAFRVVKDTNNNWRTLEQAFSVSFVEE